MLVIGGGMKMGRILAVIFGVLMSGAAAVIAAVEEKCDLPGQDLRSLSVADPLACEKACDGESSCKAFVYASGWGRCFLKTKVPKKFSIRFHAGNVRVEAGRRTRGELRADHDNKGKDLRRVLGKKNAEECAEACMGEAACQAFTYIEGYADCWLKKKDGGFIGKVFYCGVRASP